MICLVERIKKLCSDSKTSIKSLEKELGFGNGTIRRWDNNAPSIDRIVMVANHFNVPVSFITGEEQKEKPTAESGELDKETIELRSIWDSADDDERRALLEMARLIKSRRNK